MDKMKNKKTILQFKSQLPKRDIKIFKKRKKSSILKVKLVKNCESFIDEIYVSYKKEKRLFLVPLCKHLFWIG